MLYRYFKSVTLLNTSLSLTPYSFHSWNSKREKSKLGTLQNRSSLELLNSESPDQAQKAAEFFSFCVQNESLSNSQIYQDLFVLWILGNKKTCYFIEFGAVDGIAGSNSLLFEKKFGPTGIVAEPNPRYKDVLKKNRSCKIDLRCVNTLSNELVTFTDVEESPELSTISTYFESDGHAKKRMGKQFQIKTVSLNDLLKEHDAPTEIDYLSVDTEGSELEILSRFDFEKYKPKVVTVEHNHNVEKKLKLESLFEKNGYKRYFPFISAFDLWFVLEK